MCDLTITRLGEDRFWVVTGGAVGRHDIAWMRRHLPEDGSVALTRPHSSLCCLGVWGPLARDLVGARSDDDLSNEACPTCARGRSTSATCRAARCGCPTSASWAGRSTRRPSSGAGCGTRCGGPGSRYGAVACGGAAYDSLRLEKGYRLWGQDIDEEHDPYEAGLAPEPVALLQPQRVVGAPPHATAPSGAPASHSVSHSARPNSVGA